MQVESKFKHKYFHLIKKTRTNDASGWNVGFVATIERYKFSTMLFKGLFKEQMR